MPAGLQRQFVADWYNESEASNYPFDDSSSLETADGLTLPTEAILDLVIYPDPGVAPRLSAITVSRNEIKFVFSNDSGVVIAEGTKAINDGNRIVTLLDVRLRQIGLMILNEDRVLPFAGWPIGAHSTDLGVVANCVLPVESVVEGIATEDGGYASGFVYLVGDAGVVVRPEPDPNPGEEAIRIDIVGEPLFRRLSCVPQDRFRTPNFVRTINSRSADEFGEFPIVVGRHLSSEPIVRIDHDKDNSAVSFRIVGTNPEKV